MEQARIVTMMRWLQVVQHEDVRKRQQQNSPGVANQLGLRDEKIRALALDNLEPSNHRNSANFFHFSSPSMRLHPASTEAKSVL